MSEKENLKFEKEIKEGKKNFVHAYENDAWHVYANSQFIGHHLYLESHSEKQNRIVGYVKTDKVFSITSYPFNYEYHENIYIQIYKKNKHVESHALAGLKENFTLFEDKKRLALADSESLLKEIKDSFNANGTCLHFWDNDKGLILNIYLSDEKYNLVTKALKENNLTSIQFDVFFPNLYELKNKKHPFEFHYRFFHDEFNKGLITSFKISTNLSNKERIKEENLNITWLETYQRIHPVTQRIENVYFQNWVFDIVKGFYQTLFGWSEQRDDIKAIRHLLTVIALLLFFIAAYLFNHL